MFNVHSWSPNTERIFHSNGDENYYYKCKTHIQHKCNVLKMVHIQLDNGILQIKIHAIKNWSIFVIIIMNQSTMNWWHKPFNFSCQFVTIKITICSNRRNMVNVQCLWDFQWCLYSKLLSFPVPIVLKIWNVQMLWIRSITGFNCWQTTRIERIQIHDANDALTYALTMQISVNCAEYQNCGIV